MSPFLQFEQLAFWEVREHVEEAPALPRQVSVMNVLLLGHWGFTVYSCSD